MDKQRLDDLDSIFNFAFCKFLMKEYADMIYQN